MKNGNHAKGLNKKSIALVAAVALMLVGVVGGTIAWLTDTTPAITNTFKTTTVDVQLEETGATNNAKEYTMIPGAVLSKDPTVTVANNDVDVYVFVEITKENGFDTYMEYGLADGWTELEDGVIYRTVAKDATMKEFGILANDQVTVKTGVTNAQMEAIAAGEEPTLSFKAYVVQKDAAADAAGAWAIAKQPT